MVNKSTGLVLMPTFITTGTIIGAPNFINMPSETRMKYLVAVPNSPQCGT